MQNPFQRYKIYLGVLTLGIIWGSTWLAIKFGLEDAPPFFSAALRFILTFGVMDKLVGFFSKFSSCGQNGWCFFQQNNYQ